MYIYGKYGKADVKTTNIEDNAIKQLEEILSIEQLTKGNTIKIMPDTHAGKGSVVGFTSTFSDFVCPNIVGVDIGCGVAGVRVNKKFTEEDFKILDHKIINEKYIPLGKNIHSSCKDDTFDLKQLKIFDQFSEEDIDYFYRSLGSLGGGNHFIEIDEFENYSMIVVHSGSRNLGLQVANFYQKKALEQQRKRIKLESIEIIQELKRQDKDFLIEKSLKELREKMTIPDSLTFLQGQLMEDYLHDLKIVQEYAKLNRKIILEVILTILNLGDISNYLYLESIHNYVDLSKQIIRKGAISAEKGMTVLIPLNMRDGIVLGKGKGNKDWNYSAPHGAGRKFSRTEARRIVDIEMFKKDMKGIHSCTIQESTLDESSFAYKNSQEIIENLKETVDILEIGKPVYNIKG